MERFGYRVILETLQEHSPCNAKANGHNTSLCTDQKEAPLSRQARLSRLGPGASISPASDLRAPVVDSSTTARQHDDDVVHVHRPPSPIRTIAALFHDGFVASETARLRGS